MCYDVFKGVERMARSSGYLIFFLIYFIVAVVRGLGSQGKKKPGKQPADRSAAAPVRKKAQKDDCDYGEVNHHYSHEADRRIEQVNAYLKAGLIDKTEYRQMLERYSKTDSTFDNY